MKLAILDFPILMTSRENRELPELFLIMIRIEQSCFSHDLRYALPDMNTSYNETCFICDQTNHILA